MNLMNRRVPDRKLVCALLLLVAQSGATIVAQTNWEYVPSPPQNEAFLWDVDGTAGQRVGSRR